MEELRVRQAPWARIAGMLRRAADEAAFLGAAALMTPVAVAPTAECTAAARQLARAYISLPVSKVRRRLERTEANLSAAFPDWTREQVRRCAVQSFEHLFVLGVELVQAPRLLTDDSWQEHLELGEIGDGVRALVEAKPCILITGHCGNWELIGHTIALLGFPMHALYRPLDFQPFDRWVREVRERRGLTLVDKFGALRQLPRLISAGAPVGVVADQNGGDRGMFVPFFNRLASTYKSIGLLALRFNATVVCGAARREADATRSNGLKYKVEVADIFGPEDWSRHPDPLFYLTARYRRAIEVLIRRAPEQYFWMHRTWRSRPKHERLGRPFPASLEEKIRLLPWITGADLEAIKAHSARDARTLAETGQQKLS